MLAINRHADVNAINNSWNERYPGALSEWSATRYLGLKLIDAYRMTLVPLRSPTTLFGYLLPFALAQIPALLLLVFSIGKSGFRPGRMGIFIVMAVGTALTSFLFAADWGRFIYMFTFHGYMLAVVLCRNAAGESPELRPKHERDGIMCAVSCLFVLLYSTTWQMKHFVGKGSSAFRPGLLHEKFSMQDSR
jgi:hypothetical protein